MAVTDPDDTDDFRLTDWEARNEIRPQGPTEWVVRCPDCGYEYLERLHGTECWHCLERDTSWSSDRWRR